MILRHAAFSVLIAIALNAAPSTPGTVATPRAPSAPAPAQPAAARPDPESGSAATAPLAPLGASSSGIVINEAANGGPLNEADSFFELLNTGDRPVDLTGWNVYRCNEFGLRRNRGNGEVDLTGVVLGPGEIFTVSRMGAHLGDGAPADAVTTSPFPADGFGLDLEDPDGRRVDAVAVYPNSPWPMLSECTEGRNLPNILNAAAGESWQRVAVTGNPSTDFLVATRTPGAANASAARPTPLRKTVVVNELTAAGPGGPADDFVELRNRSTAPVDISGWRLYRCTATGRLTRESLQLTVPDGTSLRAGETYVVAGPEHDGHRDATAAASLADGTFGVLLETGDGEVMDRVAVSEYADTACQDGDAKLPSVLDYPAGESYQRVDITGNPDADFVIAARTPGRRNATTERSIARSAFAYPERIGVAISELANDPAQSALPAGAVQRNYVELGNYGSTTVDLSGWTIHRCTATGRRAFEPQLTIPPGTRLQPGGTFLAAREGTELAASADAGFPVAFNFLGSGVWLADDSGTRIDSVGVYQANEMDRLNDATSPCTKRQSLVTYRPDRLLAQTFQRAQFTGTDQDDFVVAEATPGRIDRRDWVDPATVDPAALAPVKLDPQPDVETADVRADTGLPAAATDLRDAVRAAYAGVAPDAALESYRGAGERRIDPADLGRTVEDEKWGHPYQRIVLDASALRPGDDIQWTGASVGRNEVVLSVWNAGTRTWRPLDRLRAEGAADAVLRGRLQRADFDNDRVTLLVQDAPRQAEGLPTDLEGAFADPADYDFALSHITDTQYLAESYPEVYAQMVSWIVANAPARKIEFVSHTGDLVQNWVDPDQNTVRAVREFERASAIQALLENSGVPNSVLPGNHDSKRGLDPSLFNRFFGPDRYAGTPWYGGSIAPDDNSANYSTFEHEGARFLMLSLPYAYGEREIAWAADVVADHPDSNVVLSTHEHLTPKTRFEPARRSNTSRWVSRATALWERVVAPNRNVVAVLSGHFHGVGQIVTADAGGIPGHTVVELLADYQEFRTHTGERATGFQRLLQVDLASGTIAVDTFSARLGAGPSFEYDYEQFKPDNGRTESASNARPWRIVEAGLQHRYTVEDDEFAVQVDFMYPKRIATSGLGVVRSSAERASATTSLTGLVEGGLEVPDRADLRGSPKVS